MKQVCAFTDGACSGNPGPGGWGAVLQFGDHEREIHGGAEDTTNNRMELTAAIEALKALNEPCKVSLTTDSTYVKDGITVTGRVRSQLFLAAPCSPLKSGSSRTHPTH